MKEKYIKEIPIKKLKNGLLHVNKFYYMSKFLTTDKYGEDRYIFRKFDIDRFVEDKENSVEKDLEEYISDFELEVIEDSTYKIYEIVIL